MDDDHDACVRRTGGRSRISMICLALLASASLALARAPQTDAPESRPDLLPRVTGHVQAKDGAPVSGAAITLHCTTISQGRFGGTLPGAAVGQSTTDRSGDFTLVMPARSVLVDEVYLVEVTHPDFAPAVLHGVTPWYLETLDKQVTLDQGRPVDGVLKLPDGRPAARTAIGLFRTAMGMRPWEYWVAGTVTDSEGHFRFERTPAEADTLIVDVPGTGSIERRFESWSAHGRLQLTLGVEQSRRPVQAPEPDRLHGHGLPGVIVEASGVPLSGRVLDRATRQPVATFAIGIRDSRSDAFAPPEDRALFADERVATGTFRFTRIRPGPSTLMVYAVGYAAQRVAVDTRPDSPPIEVLLDRGSAIVGRVVDASGNAIAHARVQAQPPGIPMEPLASVGVDGWWCAFPHAFTDADGRYRVEHVPPGDARVVAAHREHAPATFIVPVGAADAVAPDVRLEPGARINGRVVNGNQLTISSGDRAATSVPLEGDRFDVRGLPPGEYSFTLGRGSECVFKRQTVSVAANQTVDVTITR